MSAPGDASSGPVLRAADLSVSFGGRSVVRGVDLEVRPGECLAIVGESGSGKSVTARSLIGLAGPGAAVTAAELELAGRSVVGSSERDWRGARGRDVGFIAQDALVSLDPLRPIGREIGDSLRLHTRLSPAERRRRVLDALASVGLPDAAVRIGQRSGELSGGQRQRALIASAIALRPPLLLADEPTTALDVTVQAQVLDLLTSLKAGGMGILLISHDLAVVAQLADRIAVLEDGRIVETGPTEQLLAEPKAEGTRRLLAAVPFGRPRGTRLSPDGPPTRVASAASGAARAPTRSAPSPVTLEAVGLVKHFRVAGGRRIPAVDGVSFTLEPGRTLGLVGESGSGKSTVARLALALTSPDAGEVRLNGQAWSTLSERQRRPNRSLLGAVYQDALSSFDPRLTVEGILGDALRPREPRERRREEAVRLLELVELSSAVLGTRPVHLSGGQRQRVAIARALAAEPRILICDEPVSALDVSVQATVLDLLDRLQRELGLAYLFISHDLGVIQHVSDTVAVLHDGRIVETGAAEALFRNPEHPYTRRLLAAAPRLPEPAG